MTGRYKVYLENSDSNSEWLGEIPAHWIVSKFAYVKTVLTDYTANGSFADLKKNVAYKDEPSFARLVRLTDLRKDLDNDGVWIDESAYNYLKKSALFGGEFLLANVGAYAGLFYQMPYNKGPASLAPNMFMAKFSQTKILPEFMAYVGQSDPINKQLTLNATASSAQPKLNKDDFKSIKFCYPSLIEQQKIAGFLDHETAKIDTLIAKQEKLIELLKEKRQAVISHAVTKGLNPDAPMRDSGVEWLGKVPEHWFVVPIKRMCEVKDGTHDTPKYVDKGENSFPLITSKDFEGKNISFESAKYISKEAHREIVKRSNTEVGDVLMSMIGGNIGKALIVKETAEFSIKNVALFKTTRKSALASYILYYLESGLLDIQISLQSRGGAQGFLSLGDLRNLVFFKVPEDELNTIVEHLDLKISKYDRLINIASDKIALLSERKTALISAAVTGKIDVRDWKPQGV